MSFVFFDENNIYFNVEHSVDLLLIERKSKSKLNLKKEVFHGKSMPFVSIDIIKDNKFWDLFYYENGNEIRFGKRLVSDIDEKDRVLSSCNIDNNRMLFIYITYNRAGISLCFDKAMEHEEFIEKINHVRVSKIDKSKNKINVEIESFVSGVSKNNVSEVRIYAKKRYSKEIIVLPHTETSCSSVSEQYGFDKYDYSYGAVSFSIDLLLLKSHDFFSNRFIDFYVEFKLENQRVLKSKIRNPIEKKHNKSLGEDVFVFGNIYNKCDVYPYFSMFNKSLCLMYRERTEYETLFFDMKKNIAKLAFRFSNICSRIFNIREKNVVLMGEYQSETAQDNSYYFFKYLKDNNKPVEVYYVIKKESKDKERLKGYGRSVVDYFSIRHLYYLLSSKVIVSSQGREHLYIFRPLNDAFKSALLEKKYVFLQHGVTAFKKSYFSKWTRNSADKVICVGEFEKSIIVDNWGYSDNEILVTGFPRFDVLKDKSVSCSKKSILYFPTWRSWLEGSNDDEFKEDDFYRKINELISSRSLLEFLDVNNLELNIYVHIKLSGFVNLFKSPSLRVRFLKHDETPVNELLMKSNYLITDYSSVAWDFYYQGKGVSFFQFDQIKYLESHGSFIDFNHDLFGEVSFDVDSLISDIKTNFGVKNNPKDMFAYNDNRNCERIYNYIAKDISNE